MNSVEKILEIGPANLASLTTVAAVITFTIARLLLKRLRRSREGTQLKFSEKNIYSELGPIWLLLGEASRYFDHEDELFPKAEQLLNDLEEVLTSISNLIKENEK